MSAYEKAINEARLAISKLRRENGLSPTASINIPEQVPEQISPTDKPISREAALFNYAVTLLLARPQLSHADLLFFVEGMDGDISVYLAVLDQASSPIEGKIEDLQDNIDWDYQELADEDDEDFTAKDAKSNQIILRRIAKNKALQEKLQPEASFYKQADLRHLLSHTINRLLHKHRDISHETLIRRALKSHLSTQPSNPATAA